MPFQHKDQQQYLNAKYLADAGAATIIPQAELTAEKLVSVLTQFDRETLQQMAIKAKAMATPLAAQRVAEVIIEEANQD